MLEHHLSHSQLLGHPNKTDFRSGIGSATIVVRYVNKRYSEASICHHLRSLYPPDSDVVQVR